MRIYGEEQEYNDKVYDLTSISFHKKHGLQYAHKLFVEANAWFDGWGEQWK